MTTTLKIPENRQEIRKALVWIHGSLARAAIHYGITYGVLLHMLSERTPARTHADVAQHINRDLGTTMETWEK